jgi:YD repeat-containing protein
LPMSMLRVERLSAQRLISQASLACCVVHDGFRHAHLNVTSLAYDGFDRLSTTTYPDSSTEVLSYDADSDVLTRQTVSGAFAPHS